MFRIDFVDTIKLRPDRRLVGDLLSRKKVAKAPKGSRVDVELMKDKNKVEMIDVNETKPCSKRKQQASRQARNKQQASNLNHKVRVSGRGLLVY